MTSGDFTFRYLCCAKKTKHAKTTPRRDGIANEATTWRLTTSLGLQDHSPEVKQ